jgi:uncharacterized protein (TIRG00374 family)
MRESVEETPPAQSLARRVVVLLLKAVVSVGLLALLLSRTDTSRLWAYARNASPAWLALALALYTASLFLAAWRWHLLLSAQHVAVRSGWLINSYLVASFFNNFLPSNIGGDVVRIRDTAGPAGSKTVATTVVLMDRGIGLLGLLFIAATGSTIAGISGGHPPVLASLLWMALVGGVAASSFAVMMPRTVTRVLHPLRLIHQEWVEERLGRLTTALEKFRGEPRALLTCFVGAVLVQAVMVAFYAAIVHSMGIPVAAWHLAVIVPVSFVIQMAPVSVNGFGVREATFTFYFSRIGLPVESALAVSLMGAGLIILFSLSGAVAYLTREHPSSAAAATRAPVA